jgi:curved DNA-binding protein CbpA
MKDYYLILGIDPKATQEEIKRAYREMSQRYHPDKNKGDKYFEERFKDIKEAYDILSNLELRRNYDYEWLKFFRDKKDKYSSSPKPPKPGSSQNRETKEVEPA